MADRKLPTDCLRETIQICRFVEIGQGALLGPRPSQRAQPLAGNGADRSRAPGNRLEQGGVKAAQAQQHIAPIQAGDQRSIGA
jgi:hypothetical protein